jgi:hypothetical protein
MRALMKILTEYHSEFLQCIKFCMYRNLRSMAEDKCKGHPMQAQSVGGGTFPTYSQPGTRRRVTFGSTEGHRITVAQ